MVTHASGRHPIDAPGTDERTWAAWPWLSTLPGAGPIGLAGIRSAVIVAAHPDDEVLGAGGLISMLAASRARLRLVAVTDGERSHRGHASPVRSPGGGLRRPTPRCARWAPGGPRSSGSSCPTAAWPTARMSSRPRWPRWSRGSTSASPRGTATCIPTTRRRAGAARGAATGAFYSFPVWMWHWASPGDPRVPWDQALRVPLAPRTVGRKRAAITCFASQTEDRGHGLGPVLTPGMIAHFTRTVEVLLP